MLADPLLIFFLALSPKSKIQSFRTVFQTFTSDPNFHKHSWALRPVIKRSVPGVRESFRLEELEKAVDSDFLQAGLGVATKESGWRMKNVGTPRGNSYEDAKLRYVDVAQAMRSGTVVFNSAGAHIPELAACCLAALDEFGLPNCLNLYLTGKGLSLSAPPHTDKQDVFVLQCSGSKHWRVYNPPKPSSAPHADPFARGKGDDVLKLSELDEPLIDTRLEPGDVLYVPAGFPHTTHTEADPESDSESDSVHLTLGVDTHIWHLSLSSAVEGALARKEIRVPQSVDLPSDLFWRLARTPSHLGFLRHKMTSDEARIIADEELNDGLASIGVDYGRIVSAGERDLILLRLEEHAQNIVSIQRDMYDEALLDYGREPIIGEQRVTLLRVKAHLERIESAMDRHLRWLGSASSSNRGQTAVPAKANSVSNAKSVGGFGAATNHARKPKSGGKGKKKSKSK